MMLKVGCFCNRRGPLFHMAADVLFLCASTKAAQHEPQAWNVGRKSIFLKLTLSRKLKLLPSHVGRSRFNVTCRRRSRKKILPFVFQPTMRSFLRHDPKQMKCNALGVCERQRQAFSSRL